MLKWSLAYKRNQLHQVYWSAFFKLGHLLACYLISKFSCLFKQMACSITCAAHCTNLCGLPRLHIYPLEPLIFGPSCKLTLWYIC